MADTDALVEGDRSAERSRARMLVTKGGTRGQLRSRTYGASVAEPDRWPSHRLQNNAGFRCSSNGRATATLFFSRSLNYLDHALNVA